MHNVELCSALVFCLCLVPNGQCVYMVGCRGLVAQQMVESTFGISHGTLYLYTYIGYPNAVPVCARLLYLHVCSGLHNILQLTCHSSYWRVPIVVCIYIYMYMCWFLFSGSFDSSFLISHCWSVLATDCGRLLVELWSWLRFIHEWTML